MLNFDLTRSVGKLLVLGAHADDIEIGCGGTILRLTREIPGLSVKYVVFSGSAQRHAEAQSAADQLLRQANEKSVSLYTFRDAYFSHDASLKDRFESLKQEFQPDLILTHAQSDAHQDHRTINELTWNTWRNHLILEYEIPKWDGDIHRQNFYIRLDDADTLKKVDILLKCYPSQSSKHWFDAETFRGLMRLRGLESNTRYAEAFVARKTVI